jgi:hypothetical protein
VDVQATAQRAFKRFESDPSHLGLRFKLIKGDVWSVRVGMGYRALGHRNGDEITWYWIGTRQDYRQAIKASVKMWIIEWERAKQGKYDVDVNFDDVE